MLLRQHMMVFVISLNLFVCRDIFYYAFLSFTLNTIYFNYLYLLIYKGIIFKNMSIFALNISYLY